MGKVFRSAVSACGAFLGRTERHWIAVLTVYALLVIAFDTARPFGASRKWWGYPIATLDFQADNDGKVIEVTGEAAKMGLKEGYCIDLNSIKNRGEIDRRIINKLVFVSHNSSYSFGLRDEPPCPVLGNLKHKTFPVKTTDETFDNKVAETLTLLLAQVSGIIFIVLCAGLVWRSSSWRTWGLFLYSVWFNSGQYFFWYANLPVSGLVIFNIVQVFLQALGLAGFLAFALHFPFRVKGWRTAGRAYLLSGAFVVLFVFNLSGYMGFFMGWPSERAFQLYYYLTLVLYGVVACLFMETYLRQPLARPKIRWIALGGIWGLGWWLGADIYETTTMLNKMVERLQGWPWLSNYWGNKGMTEQATLNLMYAMNVTLPLTVAYTALHHRVMGLRFFLIHAIAVVVPLVVLVAVIEEGLKNVVEQVMSAEWFAVVLSVTVTVLLHDWLHQQVERWLFPRWYRERKYLEEMARQLRDGIDDLSVSEVDNRLVEDIGKALALKSAALFYSRDDGTTFIQRGVFGSGPGEYMQSLPAGYSFKGRDGKEILLTSLVDKPVHLRDPDDEDGEVMGTKPEAPAPVLAAPIAIRRRVSRLLLFDRDEDFDPDEIGVICAVTQAAAVAYRCLDVEEEARERMAEAERPVQENG